MNFVLNPSKKIRKEIGKLDEIYRQRIAQLFIRLKEIPVPVNEYDVEKIAGSDHTYRIRIGQIRVIYEVVWKEKEIRPLKIEKRKDRTYKKI